MIGKEFHSDNTMVQTFESHQISGHTVIRMRNFDLNSIQTMVAEIHQLHTNMRTLGLGNWIRCLHVQNG